MSGKQIGLILLLLLALAVSFPWWGRRLPIGDGVSLSDYIGTREQPRAPTVSQSPQPPGTSPSTAAPRPPEPTTPGVTPSAGAAAAPRWSVATAVDKLTDKQTVRAVYTARLSDDSPFLYQVAVRCDGTSRHISVTALEGVGSSEPVPRPIAFEMQSVNPDNPTAALQSVREFRFRVDDATPKKALLREQDAAFHTGVWGQGSGELVDGIKSLAEAMRGFAELQSLPLRRLAVADIFPGETVEFPFDGLTADDRVALQTTCFPSAAGQ